MDKIDTSRLFLTGTLVATPGALDALARNPNDDMHVLLLRHMCLDPGELRPEDALANERAVQIGERILSAFKLGDGTKVWVITEADRSSTCVLLPSEY